MILTRRGLLGAGLLAATGVSAAQQTENWPGFRGPRGDGTSLEKGLPVTWSATENVAWAVPIPGRGHASPVVWGDRIFLISALEAQEERILLCLDRRTGKTLWQKTALKSPLEHIHRLNSYASSTPLTDGERVYVTFLDRDQMYVTAYDFAGNRVWEVRPGPFKSTHGYSTSPVLYKDRIILNGDHDGEGFIVSLDRRTGKTGWKIQRPNNTRSYCTPLIRRINGKPHMMLTGSKCTASYNPDDGSLQWMMDGPTEQFVAAPVFDGKLLFITSGFPERHILALHPDREGKITDADIVWRTRRGCSYVPSPLLAGECLYVIDDGGFATCFRASDGEVFWRERLGSGHTASPVLVDGKIYFQSDRGTTTVIKAGPAFEKLASNELGEESYASPAVSQGQLFLRGLTHLYAIGKGT